VETYTVVLMHPGELRAYVGLAEAPSAHLAAEEVQMQASEASNGRFAPAKFRIAVVFAGDVSAEVMPGRTT